MRSTPWKVPGGYDPSGYVKGWAAGRAPTVGRGRFADHMVNAGGDIVCFGDREPGSALGWPIGIVNPFRTSEVVAVVDVRNGAIATSGRYERGDHVVDPVTATGTGGGQRDGGRARPRVGRRSASAVLVAGPECMAWFPDGPDWSVHLVTGEAGHR